MKPFALYLLLGASLSSHLLAEEVIAEEKHTILFDEDSCCPSSLTLQLSQGIRRDRHTHIIAGYKNKPTVMSELIYKNIQSYPTHFEALYKTPTLFSRLRTGYGLIKDGDQKDSDFGKDHRRGAWSRSKADVPKGYVFDLDFVLGHNFPAAYKTTFTPLVGYTFDIQKFHIRNGVQTLGFDYRIKGFDIAPKAVKCNKRLHGLRSYSRSRWNAPLVGLRIESSPTHPLTYHGEYNFLFALKYKEKAYWNLRRAHFDTSSSRRKGFGHKALVGTRYNFNSNLSLGLDYQFMHLMGKGGSITACEEKKRERSKSFRKATNASHEVSLALLWKF